MKGDGSGGISAAVAGTDYLGVGNGVRFDVAQSLTDAQKTQARNNISAAPGGYGLGAAARFLSADDDLNTIGGAGWYWWTESIPVNAPEGIPYCTMRVDGGETTDGSYATQTVFFIARRRAEQVRRFNVDAKWYPWEYENPWMDLGVEYRTTERYLGKPVYTKVINTGALAANTTDDVFHNITNIDKVWVSYSFANLSDGSFLSLPYFASFASDASKVAVSVNRSIIHRIYLGSAWTISQIVVTIKYTKTTD